MIDLNRLREMGDHWLLDPELFVLRDAVLDAPTVWWCAGHPEDMCESASPHDPPLPCRWVALVPITGEEK